MAILIKSGDLMIRQIFRFRRVSHKSTPRNAILAAAGHNTSELLTLSFPSAAYYDEKWRYISTFDTSYKSIIHSTPPDSGVATLHIHCVSAPFAN